MAEIFKTVDPINYFDLLKDIPKYIVVSSDDEFMSMDWSNMYYDKLPGEKHLIIMPNSEHSLTTGIYGALSAMGTFIRSIASGIKERPNFEYDYSPDTGKLSISIPKDKEQPNHVYLRYAQTFSKVRRDFRWVAEASKSSGLDCIHPYIPVPQKIEDDLLANFHLKIQDGGHLCLQPIVWHYETLKPTGTNHNGDIVYSIDPPTPDDGYWMGYYLEVTFPGDTKGPISVFKNDYIVSTPGYTWPNTLPFEDCFAETCIPRTV